MTSDLASYLPDTVHKSLSVLTCIQFGLTCAISSGVVTCLDMDFSLSTTLSTAIITPENQQSKIVFCKLIHDRINDMRLPRSHVQICTTVCVKILEVTSAYIFWVIHMILLFRQKIWVQHGQNFNFDFLHLMTYCRPLWVLKRQNRENLHFFYTLPRNYTGFALWRPFLGSFCQIRFIIESPIEK